MSAPLTLLPKDAPAFLRRFVLTQVLGPPPGLAGWAARRPASAPPGAPPPKPPATSSSP